MGSTIGIVICSILFLFLFLMIILIGIDYCEENDVKPIGWDRWEKRFDQQADRE